ncbi:hypothetical protein J19TS2_02430 [Cohnella xylanilytica]|nr:hypothetical protein [Cohnella xylanilytica]GIO10688.1 hypothetical protein J19TS2_02430 [Cohnella xylanilytica]
MPKRQDKIEGQAKRLAGRPVCVVLKDGSRYVGRIQGIEKGELVLSGVKLKAPRMGKSSRAGKAKVSGLFPDFGFSPFAWAGPSPAGAGAAAATGAPAGAGGAAGAAGAAGGSAGGGGSGGGAGLLGGLTGMLSFMQKALPVIRMGMGMVKTIMPLLGGLKG